MMKLLFEAIVLTLVLLSAAGAIALFVTFAITSRRKEAGMK